jgi:hypothetical protein
MWKSYQCPVGWSGKLVLVFARTVILHFGFCRVKSYVITNAQLASLSWNKAPILGLQPGIYYCQTVAGLLMWGTPVCHLQLLLALASAVILRSKCHGTHHILLSQI